MVLSATTALRGDTLSVDSVKQVIDAAMGQINVTLRYDPTYTALEYPGGDIDMERGVCTDVIIRALRSVGIDLQKLVHEDMKKHFDKYPKIWGLKKPDPNIDHRRVPNLMTWFTRRGMSLPVTQDEKDYLPGDFVTWKIPGNLDHIGLVADTKVEGTGRYGMVHNIGAGAQLEDVLFGFTITGHYRFFKP